MLTKPRVAQYLSEMETFGTHADRPIVSCRSTSLMYSAPRQDFQERLHFLQVMNARSPAGLESSPSA